MVWQDIVIAICNIFLGYALVPTIYKGFKKKKVSFTIQTTLITTLGLYVLAFTFLTLGFYFSTVMNFIIGTLWLILWVQAIIYK